MHRIHQDEAVWSRSGAGIEESNMAIKHTGANAGHRPAAARTEPQTQEETTTQIPKTTSAGPFLMHAALTPAQRRYLCTMAASYGPTRVRHLITQHYIEVRHRWKRTGYSPDREEAAVTSVTPHESETGKDQPQSRPEVSSRAKHRERKNTNTRHPGKSFLPKKTHEKPRKKVFQHFGFKTEKDEEA